MSGLALLIPVALLLGLSGLAAFFWAIRSGQFDDLDGAALRILIDEDEQKNGADHQEPPRSREDRSGGVRAGSPAPHQRRADRD